MKAPAKNPCNDCPWRRNALPGWLGPWDADEWIAIAHGDVEIACHQTIPEGFDDTDDDAAMDDMRTCAGAEIYRANVCKSARFVPIENQMDADRERVFARPHEFAEYHARVKVKR